MESLNNIKNRIQLIKNTKKITNAMELLATAKFKKIQKNAKASKIYANSLIEIVNNTFKNNYEINKILNLANKNKTLFIIIGSDLGLCGGYNINIFKEVKNQVKKEDKIIAFGTKVINFLNEEYRDQIIETHDHYGDEIQISLLDNINKIIDKKFIDDNQISQIKVIYTEFINSVTFKAQTKTLLPFENKMSQNSPLEIEYIPSFRKVVYEIIPLYLKANIFNFLIESKISEMASRRSAMENATNNAAEIIDDLQIAYNKRRQADITKEITEIISGVNN
ncbi:ATP synthase F1 subunit gamma [[Mycoplasma] collis]|uniref:ATP synthase F1 subunit gamma n=1 Tax=[Mycoplasma] collis TaxID=2127 RepID=UPI00051C04D9|nr:ATP synthase F1 subunit gamma [[Mycoplasma] collis]